jgi:uncharacterized protein (DUF488 family)
MPENSSSQPPVVLTVGHSNHLIEEFLRLVQAYQVTLVIDVRKLPGSRRNEQFKQSSLSQSLREVGIEYAHMPGLGGLRRRQPNSPNGGWNNVSFQGYADYMLTPDFEQSLRKLLVEAHGQRIALMCAEAVPWRCHRSLIADALVARGIAVQHILSASRSQAHVLRPWAKVQGTRITYPLQEQVGQGENSPPLDRKAWQR